MVKLSGQLRSYNLMVSLMSDQVRSLQWQLEQQQKIPQAYLAIQIPLPAPAMPMWTGVTTPLESPPNSPFVTEQYMSPATSRSSSPAMVPQLMPNAYSSGSNTGVSAVSPEREMSPFNLK